MDEDKIIKILKGFSAIRPSADFIGRSKPLVLSARRSYPVGFGRFFAALKIRPVLVLATLMFLVVGGFAYLKISNVPFGSDNDNLLVEAADLNANIRLKEAKYFDESIKEVATVLEKVSTQPNNSTPDKGNIDNQELNKKGAVEKIIL